MERPTGSLGVIEMTRKEPSIGFRLLHRVAMPLVLAAALQVSPALGQKNYGPGVTDTEIKIGQTMPYSGPLSGMGTHGKAMAAYFTKLNEEGGVGGRRIKLISLDDGYSPPKTVEQTRRLVEQEEVLLLFGSFGTATNSAIQRYVNAKRVPHLFLVTGGSKFHDPKNFPWTMGFVPTYYVEAKAYAKYVLKNYPNAKIGILYQNDDFGKDLLMGLKDALGDRAPQMIVSEVSYEVTDPTVDQQIVAIKASGADVFVSLAAGKISAQAIRKTYDIGWKPVFIVPIGGSARHTVLEPAGLEKAVGLISGSWLKDPGDPQWANDAAVQDYLAFMKKYYPEGDPGDVFNVNGYTMAQAITEVLRQCRDDLTRENVLRQATGLKDLGLPMLLQGLKLNTSSQDYQPVKQLQLARFDGTRWVRFGDLVGQ
jgi:ABC-type branched-subunit amino acid transport system substrate-binding protein